MFDVIDPFSNDLQKLEDHLDVHCFCSIRPSEYCPIHNQRSLLDLVEAKTHVDEKAAQEKEDEDFDAGREEATEELEARQNALEEEIQEALAPILHNLGVKRLQIVQRHADIMECLECIEQEVLKLKAPGAREDGVREQVELAQKAVNAAMDLLTEGS